MSTPYHDPLTGAFDEEPPAPVSQEPAYLDGLNEEQRQAVETTDGPVLVLAGAGTGKTRVLTTRIAHLLRTGKAWPGQILAVTFTNKAAREMQDRIGRLIGGVVEGMPWLGTFHSIGARMLRRHAELVGLKPNFTILDDDDQLRLLKQVMSAHDIDDKRWPARQLLAQIDKWKNRGLVPHAVPAGEGHAFADGQGIKIYEAYQERLATLNACDFGDLLVHNLTILKQHGDVLADYHRRFAYILVDEYQDTNVAQYLWLKLLAQGRRNICCVGDDDQSIYGWRGADVGNILKFESDFPGAKIIRLERNYRSTPHILAAASGLIAGNQDRLGKTLWTDLQQGEKVTLRGVWDDEEEARTIADDVEAKQRQGRKLAEMAVLVRAGFQTRAFEERFLTLGIPYRVIGGLRFYERMEIRDAIAYLRVMAQSDDDLAFERIVNKPKRGIGDSSLQILHKVARDQRQSLLATARNLVLTEEIPGKARRSLNDLIQAFDRWRALSDNLPVGELVELILDESGYTAMWQNDKSVEAPGRLENLKELIHAVENFETIAGFLEHVALVMENEQSRDDDMISMMSLHAAKGLEFPIVFLPGWEEGLFPHQRALDESGIAGLEEERRLAYVGLTRAREEAHISFAANRRIHGSWTSALPSRFLDEIPKDNVDISAERGLYGSSTMTDRWADADFGSSYSTPGWRRAQNARDDRPKSRPPLLDLPAQSIQNGDPDAARFAKGTRVFHQKFGYGRIRLVDGNKLTVDFDKAGEKRVIDTFVSPA
jgi:DNA helicase-2/ATP-dependent DNA helicase PcrA